MLSERARAKVNLTLRVLGRRADGYHELDSLVAFASVGDTVSLAPERRLALTISGPHGLGLASADNLVLRAAGALAAVFTRLRLGAFHLVKRLPVASGIGGGSADAAAAIRLLCRLNDIGLEDPRVLAVSRSIGADLPVCLASKARIMRGIGDELGPELHLPPLFAVLVNPGVAVETRAVFSELGLEPGTAINSPDDAVLDDFATTLRQGRNDLEAPAHAVAPQIGRVLSALRTLPECRLARMSGSGATCFGLFDDCRKAAAAAQTLATGHPAWWVKPTLLR